MSDTERMVDDFCVLAIGGIFLLALVLLGVRLKEVQIDSAAKYNLQQDRQASRLVQTAAPRGRILDCRGREIAVNRKAFSIAVNPEAFQRRRSADSVKAIIEAVERLSSRVRAPLVPDACDPASVRRHMARSQALPYVVMRGVSEKDMAVFFENSFDQEGFSCVEYLDRHYPFGRLACHLTGYVGRGEADTVAGDEKMNFKEKDLVGRSGIEMYRDAYLRGVPGERRLTVDARGYTVVDEIVRSAIAGPDLTLTLDVDIQKAVERELDGHVGACVVMDALTGDVLAAASSPSYDLNDFVPVLSHSVYSSVTNDSRRPLLNRAFGGTYAPGSIFKPVTALAALAAHIDPAKHHMCLGFYKYGTMTLRCASRWGHGDLDMTDALKHSCNPYFADAGIAAGTNLLMETALKFGLGSPTGVDFPVDSCGNVPDGQSREGPGGTWYPGDLPQTAIGQGKLLVTPLQMAVMAAALGTGFLPTPRVNGSTPARRRALDIPRWRLDIVRKGMRKVVERGGTGASAAKEVEAFVIGKTGTAEVGTGARRRKNTWFIAYASPDAAARPGGLYRSRHISVAMVIESGESGGSTTAPKVCRVLKKIYN